MRMPEKATKGFNALTFFLHNLNLGILKLRNLKVLSVKSVNQKSKKISKKNIKNKKNIDFAERRNQIIFFGV